MAKAVLKDLKCESNFIYRSFISQSIFVQREGEREGNGDTKKEKEREKEG